ncbi:MAG TPA: hypothetical protein VMU50_00565 [Polyangia bacterium]|nr:hypothetical protein [Polyangia bacterium]
MTSVSIGLAFPVNGRAQDAPAAQLFKPAEPASDGPPPPAANPAPPPAPALPTPPPAPIPRVPQAISAEVPAAPPAGAAKTSFALELHTDGFLGGLRDGVFLGGGGRRFTAGGLFSFAQTNFGGGQKGTAFAIGPSFRWALASGVDDRVDLTFDLNGSFFKAFISDGQTFSKSDGYGFVAAFGPGLRFWITKSLALTYSALVTGELRRSRTQDVEYFSNWQQVQFGQANVGPRPDDVFYLYFTGRLALTGYF